MLGFALQGIPSVLVVVGHFFDFPIGSEFHMLEIGLYRTLFRLSTWKFLLHLSNKSAIESNSHYINPFTSHFMYESVNKVSHSSENSWKTPVISLALIANGINLMEELRKEKLK